jgi:hypothetical protein
MKLMAMLLQVRQHARVFSALCAMLMAGVWTAGAKADVTYTTVPGSTGDGPVAATVTFAAGNGVLAALVTNTQPGANKNGQAISDFNFKVAGLATPTSFITLSGVSADFAGLGLGMGDPWTLATGTSFTDAVVGNVDRHWKFSTAGSSVALATAGGNAPGGSPTNMILPDSGTIADGLGAANHQPYLLGPTLYIFTDPGLTSSTVLTSANFSNVTVSFGTGPDALNGGGTELPTTTPGVMTPEPSALVSAGMGLAGLAFAGIWYRRRKLLQTA